jgi:hypothetical protein
MALFLGTDVINKKSPQDNLASCFHNHNKLDLRNSFFLHSFGSNFVKWSASEKGKLCSATKLLNNVSDNITLDDFLSTKLVIPKLCK